MDDRSDIAKICSFEIASFFFESELSRPKFGTPTAMASLSLSLVIPLV